MEESVEDIYSILQHSIAMEHLWGIRQTYHSALLPFTLVVLGWSYRAKDTVVKAATSTLQGHESWTPCALLALRVLCVAVKATDLGSACSEMFCQAKASRRLHRTLNQTSRCLDADLLL